MLDDVDLKIESMFEAFIELLETGMASKNRNK